VINSTINQANFTPLDSSIDQTIENILRDRHDTIDASIVEAAGIPIVLLDIIHPTRHDILRQLFTAV
jgi:hypothetical protein